MQSSSPSPCGIILLAAGRSARLGMPKQLLQYQGNSLVERAARIALELTNQLVVVTGAENEKVEEALRLLPVRVVHNNKFEQGIASSIQTGITAILEYFKETSAIIFIVCDQPYLSPNILQNLLETAIQTNKGIVACRYENAIGIPVYFRSEYFARLLQLKGDAGAKKIILENLEDVVTVEFPLGSVDIDTMQDYENLFKTED